MTGRSARRLLPATALVVALAGATGCGGEDQSANEQSGTFKVEVVRASFPEVQHLAEQSVFAAEVRNAGDRTIDQIAVTLDGFATESQAEGLSDAERPVWVVDDGPSGGATAYNETWALGRLAPGETRTFRWKVSALQPGEHRLRWRVSAGLTGKAQAVTPDDRAPEGQLVVRIDNTPAESTVDPATGEIQREY